MGAKNAIKFFLVISMTTIGVVVISPMIRKVENKLYKQLLRKQNIDYEYAGPEYVKKTK